MTDAHQGMSDLLKMATERASRYLDDLDARSVVASPEALQRMAALDLPLPDAPTAPIEVIRLLDDVGAGATVATAGGRYFGFVTGGVLPTSLAANWLAGAWDQNAASAVMSPVGFAIEEIAQRWLVDVLGLPGEANVAFVTGATMANFSGLAAARQAVLQKRGWDVGAKGLFDAPPITVVVGEEVHVSLLKALSLLGLGRERVLRVPVDGQGRMRADALPQLPASTIVCIQAGNVNTGAFDPAEEICAHAHKAGAWVHVDGAFGLWAAVAPERSHLARAFAQADSWALDGHKWLNVPYDSGMAICRHPESLRAAMSVSAPYLERGTSPPPRQNTPEMSRRARGIEIWAALLSLGRSGLAELVERTCKYATRFANGLAEAGYEILNDVVINQVLVSFGDADTTQRVIARLQQDGTCWCGGTVWQGHAAMRISVSSWVTTEADVDRSLAAMLRIAAEETANTK